jgi:hypothetical protein
VADTSPTRAPCLTACRDVCLAAAVEANDWSSTCARSVRNHRSNHNDLRGRLGAELVDRTALARASGERSVLADDLAIYEGYALTLMAEGCDPVTVSLIRRSS